MGMTDLQFKSYLKCLVRIIEAALRERDPEALRKQLEDLLTDLKGDIES